MDKSEAYRLLGISKKDSAVTIKRKYHRLMHMHHPDSTGKDDLYMSQRINAAYQLIKDDVQNGISDDLIEWESDINPYAFCERSVFVDYSFLDKRIPIREVAEGRYLWDPYLEEFNMLARSVAIRTADLVREYSYVGNEADVFHLLMQEYIEPISCIRKLGEVIEENDTSKCYEFTGAIGISDRNLLWELRKMSDPVRLMGMERINRIAVYDDSGVIYGELSYDDDSLYYVVNPVIVNTDKDVAVEIITDTLHTGRRDLNFEGKLDVKIRICLKNDFAGDLINNNSKIREILD